VLLTVKLFFLFLLLIAWSASQLVREYYGLLRQTSDSRMRRKLWRVIIVYGALALGIYLGAICVFIPDLTYFGISLIILGTSIMSMALIPCDMPVFRQGWGKVLRNSGFVLFGGVFAGIGIRLL
jgi:hypothetical protein